MSTNPYNPYASISEPVYASAYFCAIMTTAFYGVACMQTFFYYVHYQSDPLRMKIFVAIIWRGAVNTFHEGLTIAGAYKYLMAGLANPLSFLNGATELTLQVLPTAVVAVLAQGFLMHRIYVFSGKKYMTLALWLIPSLLQLVATTVYVGKAVYGADGGLHVVDITVLNDKTLTTTITLSLCAAATEDILIAIILVFLLIRQRTATRFANTVHMLQRLTVFAVNTGTWTATFALLSLIFLQVLPSKVIYIVFAIPLCSVYANTVLANLNVRAYLMKSGAQPISVDLMASATSNPNGQRRQTKLIFAAPDALRTARESTSFSDANARSTVTEEV